jgi:hypothetical protein
LEASCIHLLAPRRQLKIVFVVTMLICIFLIMVGSRVFYGSMRAYQKGEAYLNDGQYIKAVTFFDRSMHWYTPLNPYVQKSAQHLWEISMNAQDKGDIRLSLIAVKTIKRGFIAARSFYTPGRDWIEKCNLRIRELRRTNFGQKTGEKVGGSVNPMSKETEGKAPDVMWSIILLIGLFGWIVSVIAMVMRPLFKVSQNGGIWRSWTLKWILCAAAFFAVWILGMVNA